jgi:hypothetical protein
MNESFSTPPRKNGRGSLLGGFGRGTNQEPDETPAAGGPSPSASVEKAAGARMRGGRFRKNRGEEKEDEEDEACNEGTTLGLLQHDGVSFSPNMLNATEVSTDLSADEAQKKPLVASDTQNDGKLSGALKFGDSSAQTNGAKTGASNGSPQGNRSPQNVSSSDEQTRLDRTASQETARENKELFMHTPHFITALTDLADDLIPAALEDRNMLLRKGLAGVQARFLPSDVLYLPVCNPYHRVKKIHIDESFCFSTKERVPCLLVVEVVDYAFPQNLTGSRRRKKRRRRKRVRTMGEPQKFTMRLPFSEKQLQLQITKTVQVTEDTSGDGDGGYYHEDSDSEEFDADGDVWGDEDDQPGEEGRQSVP